MGRTVGISRAHIVDSECDDGSYKCSYLVTEARRKNVIYERKMTEWQEGKGDLGS